MDSALWIAKSGLEAHHKHIEVISNNLANANNNGFKKNRPEFEDLAYQVMRQPGAPTTEQTNSPNGIVIGTGVKIASNKKIFSQGSMIQADNYDVAIMGRGFIKVEVPNQPEPAYTRTGSLNTNEQGQLVINTGYIIQPPINIPPGSQGLSISSDGKVSVQNATGTTEEIGSLELSDFINPAGLFPIGENLYKETVSSGNPTSGSPGIEGLGKIQQGMLEASNVNIVEEMVNLIEAQRTFEVTSKAISAVDNMLQTLNSET